MKRRGAKIRKSTIRIEKVYIPPSKWPKGVLAKLTKMNQASDNMKKTVKAWAVFSAIPVDICGNYYEGDECMAVFKDEQMFHEGKKDAMAWRKRHGLDAKNHPVIPIAITYEVPKRKEPHENV